jgi:hypothetical protein
MQEENQKKTRVRQFCIVGRCHREHQQQFRDDTLVRSVGATDALSERNLITVSMCRSISPRQENADRQSASVLSKNGPSEVALTGSGHALRSALGQCHFGESVWIPECT